MVSEINRAWSWLGFVADEVILTNDFGNVILRTENNDYWRICPEELTCKKIAENISELEHLLSDPEFLLDWQMTAFVAAAKKKLGGLEEGRKYCLKIPGVLDGDYQDLNFGTISFSELILCSGDLAFQIKDLKDGDEVDIIKTD